MFWRDMTLSVWRKKTTGLKTKKRLLPLVLAAALCSSPVWAEEATFTANFKDTDLKSFIETVGANLNKTIIMGPGVQGKVSIRTMTPLNERQYYQLFLNLLEAQGYAVVPMENDVLKVVKSSAAKVEPLPLVGEGSDNYAGDEMVTKVVPVRNVSVRELAPILRQMIDSAGSGNVVNYDPSNVIMLTGRASVVERLTEVIQRVDHAGNRTEEVIPLDNASASEIARVLESLTKNSGENQPATLKSQIVADERTNSVIVSGDPATRDKMRRLIRRLDSEMERSGNSQVFYLKYSKAEDLVDVLKQVSGTLTAAKEEAEGTVGSGREVVSIAASKHSNALIVTAPQDIMQSLQSVIEQLDIRRAQVHVEALIVEVAEGSNINFGVQWASKDAGLMQFANGTQIPIGTLGAAISQAKPQKGSTVISENGATTINPDTNGDLSTLAQLLSGFSGTAVGVVKGDWMALVQAVKNDSSSNVLSTPSITTLDNQEAFFMVGQDVPVLTGSTVGSNNSNPFNTLHIQDTQVRTLAERDNMVNLLQQQANALQQQLDGEQQTKNQLQHAYGLLEAQHDTLGLEYDALKKVSANLQQQLEEGQLVQQTLQQSIDEQTLALAAASKQCDELTQLIAVHESNIASQSDVMAAQQAEYKQLTEALSALQQQLAVEQTTHQQQISERDLALAERFSETVALTRLLEERTQIITELEIEKQLLTTKLSGVEQQLRAEQESLQQAQSALLSAAKEKQHQLDELESVLNERYSEIATLTRWLEERDQALLSAASEQQQTNETYRAQQQAWKEEKEALIREQTLLQSQQSVLQDQVRELTTLNGRLEANIAERFQELAVMTRHMEQLSCELKQKERQLNRAKERAQNLKRTVSWKITAPVRALGRTFKEETPSRTTATESAAERIAASGLFDELWYQHRYPEVADTGLSALEHFISVGADKGYSPSEQFDTRWYLQTYPDVAQGGINPLLHYIMYGKFEQRSCLPVNKGE